MDDDTDKETSFALHSTRLLTILIHDCRPTLPASKETSHSYVINVNVPFLPMSFHHRVLPLPPALSDQALRDRWAIQPDTLLSSKIMPDETTRPAASEHHQSPTPAPPRSSSTPPEEDAGQKSPGEESLEDYESPKLRTHSLSQAAGTSNRSSRADQASLARKSVVEKWQEDTPSSICLCQPDPKVPRPRNGTCTTFLHAS